MYKDLINLTQTTSDYKAINNSIKNILLTRKGSVPGNPRFGSDLYKLLFTQMDQTTESIAKNFIKEALSEFEDRIIIDNISFTMVDEYNKVVCNIDYRYRDEISVASANVNLSLS
jgi:phage baseplate assembly protein W